jgi:hypothetical protein
MSNGVTGYQTEDIPILSDVFGAKPAVAPYTPTIFSDEQLKALTENLAAMPKISALGTQYYDYMSGAMERAIPGFADILKEGGTLTAKMESVAGQELAGQIPQDVVDQVQRSSAYQSLLSGTSGSQMASANLARNLGLTSLDLIGAGANLQGQAGNAAQQWSGLAARNIMNPAAFFISPQEQAAQTMQNNLYRQATQQLANNLAAAPSPVAKGVSDTIINLLGAYLGAGKGGGAGGTAPSYSPSQYAGQQPDYSAGAQWTAAPSGTAAIGASLAGPQAYPQTPFNVGAPQSYGQYGLPQSYGGYGGTAPVTYAQPLDYSGTTAFTGTNTDPFNIGGY